MSPRALSALPIAGIVLALAPASASADKLFTGETQQDRPAVVRTGADGVVNLARVTWKTSRCRTDADLQLTTGFRPPFDSATPDAFSDVGTYTHRLRGGIRIRVTPTITGTRIADAAGERWRGTFRATAVVRRDGRVIDRCTQRQVGWTALLRGA